MNDSSKDFALYVRNFIMDSVGDSSTSTFSAYINDILVQARGVQSDDVRVVLSADPVELSDTVNEDLLMITQCIAINLVSEYTNHDASEFYLHEVYTPMNHTVICHVLDVMT